MRILQIRMLTGKLSILNKMARFKIRENNFHLFSFFVVQYYHTYFLYEKISKIFC